MTRKRRIVTRERLAVLGDALLLTSAAHGLVIGLGAVLVAPETEWMVAASSIMSLLVAVIAPIGVWVAHGRRLSLAAVAGGLVGGFCSGFALMALVAVAAVVDLLLGSAFAGPMTVLGLVCLGYLAVVGWLIADAVRDLGPGRGMHRGIDAARLVAVAVLTALTVGTIWWVRTHPGDESWEVLVFTLVAGVGGALAVFGALVLTSVTSGQRDIDHSAADGSSATAPTSNSA